ncbi:MAG: serine/threonine protein kinase [Candidatus Obscuribacterales bacterium]|nr:serine/threonine protein kinase [Candidatus Obscuribacterales bacterium]
MKNVLLDDSLVGQTIGGNFVITRWIGMGGMGTTYEAKQIDLDRRVCIKFLKVEGLSDPESFQRFKREARVLSKLQHDFIVSCFSFGLYESIYPFLVLELVEGASLKALATDSALEWKRACLLLIQLCQALEFAHKLNFVHRDLKPENILVTSVAGEESVKLIDFGLVGLQTEATAEKLTAPGSIMGSVNYMAPECFKGVSPNKSQDIYAFGCVMYYLLSGLEPFAADSPIAVMYKHANERLPKLPSESTPDDVRDSLEKIIWRCTAPMAADRPDDCSEVRQLLGCVLDGLVQPEIAKINESEPRSRRTLLAFCSAMTIVALAIIALGYWRDTTVSAVPPSEPPLAQIAAIVVPEGTTWQLSESDRLELAKQSLLAIDLTLRDLNLRWGRQRTSAEHQILTAETEKVRDKLDLFLRNEGQVLHQQSKVASEVRALCFSLSDLLSTLAPRVSNVRLEANLRDLQCDLLTSFGCYRGGLEIVRSGKPINRSFVISQNELSALENFHKEVCARFDRTNPERAVVLRLRPVIRFYPKLNHGETLFGEFLCRYKVVCANGIVVRESWQPQLCSIFGKFAFKNKEQMLSVAMDLVDIQTSVGQVAQAQKVLAILRANFLPKLDVELVSSKLLQVGQSRESEELLNVAIARAFRRNQPQLWCRYKSQLVLMHSGPSMGQASAKSAMEILKSKQWKAVEAEWAGGVDPVTETTVSEVLNDLLLTCANCLKNGKTKGVPELLEECQRILLAGNSDAPSYAMTLHQSIRSYSDLQLFKESLAIRRAFFALVERNKKQFPDGFFPYAAKLELARGLWLSGQRLEAKKLYAECAADFAQLSVRCRTGGWIEWTVAKLDWFREAGFVKEADRLQSTLNRLASSDHYYGK